MPIGQRIILAREGKVQAAGAPWGITEVEQKITNMWSSAVRYPIVPSAFKVTCGVTHIPAAIVTRPDLSPREKVVLSQLIYHARLGRRGECFAHYSTIKQGSKKGNNQGIGATTKVTGQAISSLATKGWLTIKKRGDGRNAIRFMADKLVGDLEPKRRKEIVADDGTLQNMKKDEVAEVDELVETFNPYIHALAPMLRPHLRSFLPAILIYGALWRRGQVGKLVSVMRFGELEQVIEMSEREIQDALGRTGLQQRTVQRAISTMESLGLLLRTGIGGNQPDRYRFGLQPWMAVKEKVTHLYEASGSDSSGPISMMLGGEYGTAFGREADVIWASG